MSYCVMDIGGTFIKYADMDKDGNILFQDKMKTPLTSFDEFYNVMDQLIKKEHEGIAVSFPGPVDTVEGIVIEGGSLKYMKQFAFVEEMQKRYGIPCSLENDARCAALAEVWQGNLKNIPIGMVVVFGTGIGSSLTINGQVFKGAHNFSGEISCLITKDIDTLGWGASFHHDAGVPFLLKKVQEAKHLEVEIDGKELFEMLEARDDIAWSIFTIYCEELAKQFYNMQCMFDPQRICIGGGISLQPLFLSELQKAMKEFWARIPVNVPMPEILPCKFHNDSNLLGSLYNFLHKK